MCAVKMSTVDWFRYQVLQKRYSAIVGWSLFIQVCLLWTVKLFSVLICSVFGFGSISTSTVIYSQFYLALLQFLLCILFFKNVKVHPELSGSPLSSLCCILRPQSWLRCFFFMILGALWAQCYSMLMGSSSFESFWEQTPECSEKSACCVNEHHLFVFLHGAFTGLYFCFTYHVKHLYCLKFETVQQLKLPSAKAKLKAQLKESVIMVLKYIRWFYICYYLFGFLPKYIMSSFTGQTFCNHDSLTTLLGLINFELLWITFITGISIFASWSMTVSLVQVFLTEPYVFPVEATFEKDRVCLLTSAMLEKQHELLQHLGFQNLSFISQHSSVNRKKIYAISIPGGHPYTWKEVSSQCLKVIDDFQLSLSQAIESTSTSRPVKLASTLKTSKASSPQKPLSQTAHDSLVNLDKVKDVKGWLNERINKATENIMNKSVIKFLTLETGERKLERLFCNCQLLIWSVQALTFLASASFREDHHGVVQWSLPKIISSLLELQLAVERSPKGLLRNNVSSSKDLWSTPPKSLCLRQSLRASINSGLYHISCTFKHHLKYIELSEDHQNRIDRYLQMKE